MKRMKLRPIFILLLCCSLTSVSYAQTVTVNGSLDLIRKTEAVGKAGNAVVWLRPAASKYRQSPGPNGPPRQHFKMIQQHKKFDPHILAVPVGSIVEFPNLDPFFHNVFSMFDGKRFDLGLYEAGGAHSVSFDAPGVCYIFCNIHPEMSAAIVVVDSPYYATSRPDGQFSIPNVEAGHYLLYVWHERGKPESAKDSPLAVTVSADSGALAPIRLVDAGEVLANHKNKYGRDYDHKKSAYPIPR
jgi:plastocyanin